MENPRDLSYGGYAGVGGQAGLAQIFRNDTPSFFQVVNARRDSLVKKDIADDLAKAKIEKENQAILNLKPEEFFFNHEKELSDMLAGIKTEGVNKIKQGINIQKDAEFLGKISRFQTLNLKSKDLNKRATENLAWNPAQNEFANNLLYSTDYKKWLFEPLESINLNNQPNKDDDKYFLADEFLATTAKEFEGTISSDKKTVNTLIEGDYGGSMYKKTSDGEIKFRFMTKDENGNYVPGVDDKHINYFMLNPRYKIYLEKKVDKILTDKALELETDPLKLPEVISKLAAEKGGRLNMQRQLAREQIGTLQTGSEKTEEVTQTGTTTRDPFLMAKYGAGQQKEKAQIGDRIIAQTLDGEQNYINGMINAASKSGTLVTLDGEQGFLKGVKIETVPYSDISGGNITIFGTKVDLLAGLEGKEPIRVARFTVRKEVKDITTGEVSYEDIEKVLPLGQVGQTYDRSAYNTFASIYQQIDPKNFPSLTDLQGLYEEGQSVVSDKAIRNEGKVQTIEQKGVERTKVKSQDLFRTEKENNVVDEREDY